MELVISVRIPEHSSDEAIKKALRDAGVLASLSITVHSLPEVDERREYDDKGNTVIFYRCE